MISWLLSAAVCLLLIMGCGGGHRGALVKKGSQVDKPEVASPAPVAVTDDKNQDDNAALTEELNPTRLEELYAKSGIPGWDPSMEEELKKWEHQVQFDVPIQMNKQVRAYLVYFSTERKEVIRRYLARSTRYLPLIKGIFQEYGLPEDLAYLAMIESGFNTKAYSPAAASGMWQFIKGTGLRYGLAIDSYVDERRDPEKSTRAAAKYLLDLYKQFGSWYLAAASYNCGENRVQRELDSTNHKNFWELSANMCLPTETKNYVPQMIAATIIAKNPEKFGFKGVPYLPALKYDQVKVIESTSLTAAATAVNVPTDEIQSLNPQLTRGVTPPGLYMLNLPANSKELFSKNISLARIEHPAVAAAPVRTARASSHPSYSSRSSHHSRQVDEDEEVASSKPAPKHATYAKFGRKTGTHLAAAPREHESAHQQAKAAPARGHAPVMTASMFGSPGLASKNGKSKVALIGTSKSGSKVKSKKSAETHLARKSDSSHSKAGKKSSSSHSRDRYSKGKSRSKALLVSEAR